MTLRSVVAALAFLGVVTPPAAAVEPEQALAALRQPHAVFSRPAPAAARTGHVAATRPITRARTVLPVLRRRTVDGTRWLRVRLPGRPNGHTGWIKARATVSKRTRWHVVVAPARRRVLVFNRARRVRSFSAIVGTAATPTPAGRFFVEENVLMPPGSVGAPFALALSARSNVLQEFAGGPGQTAIHGTGNVGGVLGTAASHGCVRLGGRAIRWLAARIPAGAPVTIR